MRTRLRIRYPANREKIREFSQFLQFQVAAYNLKRRLLKALHKNSLRNGTGNSSDQAANVLSGTGKLDSATANQGVQEAGPSRHRVRLTPSGESPTNRQPHDLRPGLPAAGRFAFGPEQTSAPAVRLRGAFHVRSPHCRDARSRRQTPPKNLE